MNSEKLTQLAKMAEGLPPFTNSGMFPPSRYYRFLYNLAIEKKPKISVVLGVCGGGCCHNLCIGSGKGKVYGVDVANSYPKNIEYLEQHPNFQFVIADSVMLASEKTFSKIKVDVLFIDTVHTYDQTIAEFNAWHPRLADDAVVLLDDLFRDGMKEAFEELPGEKLRFDTLHIGGSDTDGGFGVVYNIPEVK